MLMKVLGATSKESSKYLRVEWGRVLYQFTIRMKLPEKTTGLGVGKCGRVLP